MELSVRKSEKSDFISLATAFDAFNAEVGAPHHNQQSYIFQIKIGDKIAAEAIVEKLFGVVEPKIVLVDKAFRRQGLGRQLLSAIEKFAIENKASALIVWTTTWQGQSFYERCGFKELTRIPLETAGHFNGAVQYNILYEKKLKR